MQKNCKIGIALVPLILAVIILFGICIGTLLITNKRNENNEMDVKQDEENKITDDNPLNDVRSDLQNEVRVGDYVKYIADNSDSVKWRVLEIDEKNSKINIIPTSVLGNIQLKGQEDWLNAEEKINEECQKYTSESLEITKNDIRSLKIEDIELFIDSTEIENAKNMDDYGTIYIPSNQEGGMIAKYSSG